MTRFYRRASRNQRVVDAVPHGHWKTSTFIGALRCDGLTAPGLFVSRPLAQLPGLANCVAAAKRLNKLLRKKSKETLDKVLEDAGSTALKEFVASLRRDLAAVQAAINLPWTTAVQRARSIASRC
jgi:hypothetical protein